MEDLSLILLLMKIIETSVFEYNSDIINRRKKAAVSLNATS